MKVFEFDMDNVHYWAAAIGLGSKMANSLLSKAMSEGRCPMSLSDLAIEMIDEAKEWCDANCTTAYELDPHYQLQVWFTNPNDAMRFKLTFG